LSLAATSPGKIATGARRTEYFRIEHEAHCRAREPVESGVHHGISVYDAAAAASRACGCSLN
jgi:hypothetical protein